VDSGIYSNVSYDHHGGVNSNIAMYISFVVHTYQVPVSISLLVLGSVSVTQCYWKIRTALEWLLEREIPIINEGIMFVTRSESREGCSFLNTNNSSE
jgi:hypothetical protein